MMRAAASAACACLLLLATHACAQVATREWRGLYGGPAAPTERLARSPAEWAEIRKLFGIADDVTVDFATHMVAAVGIGTRRTGGYAVTITGAEEREGAVHVRYAERAPGSGEIVTQALTTPYHVRVLPRLDAKTVRFERVTEQRD